MSSIVISLIALLCIVVGMLAGLLLRNWLPQQHLLDASKDSLKMGAGLIATLAALVLGLLVTSAKSSFDAMSSELTQVSTKIILLDRALAQYGGETKEIRDDLRRTAESAAQLIWPNEFSGASRLSRDAEQQSEESIEGSIRALAPSGESQQALRSEALGLANDLSQLRWLLFEQSHTALPTAFMVLLIFWLAVLFGTFGLLAPRNATVIVVLIVCAISIASAIFLIREMNHPLRGAVQVSSAPARQALNQLGR